MEQEVTRASGGKVTNVSILTLYLMASAVGTGAFCALLHSHVHGAACFLRVLALILGTLAILRLLNSISAHLPLFLAKTIRWINAVVFEVFALLFIALLRLYSFTGPFRKAAGRKEGPPILLVHGYINSATVWIYLRQKLAKEGLGPIYTINLRRPFSSIRKHAEKVARKAEQIREETGHPDLILVGHSMGGVVSTYYTAFLAPKSTVSKVITLASPLAGTHIASLAPGANAREMEWNSPFIQELNRKILELREVKFYNIETTTDLLIVPASSALLKMAVDQVVYEDIGHASLLFSPRVGAQLVTWLKP